MSPRPPQTTPRLSSPLHMLQPHYEVVVVGSGYGGGVAASRLARAGRAVCVLERGREFRAGEFPDSELKAALESQVSTPALPGGRIGSPLALFDFLVEGEYSVLRGCGLGGTSLINAGVALEADPRVFGDARWPAALRADLAGVHAGYRRAKEVLSPRPYPRSWPRLAKLSALKESAKRLGEPWRRVPINVSFEDGVNDFGVKRFQCNLCGDCVTGCNNGAKNTVAATYLPDAWNHGASLFTEISVSHVVRRAEGRWAVHCEPVGSGREAFEAEPLVVFADVVVLAAGTLGSTGILLRSREHGLATSDRLGERFSGNADVIAFGYNNDVPINGVGAGAGQPDPKRPVGPTITSMIDGRAQSRPVEQHYLIQEGALPGAIDAIYPASFRAAARQWGVDTDEGIRDRIAEDRRAARSRLPGGARAGALANTQTFLAMGHDSGDGQLRLDDGGKLRVSWPSAASAPVIADLNARILEATAANGGTYVPNPAWSNHLQSGLITVHPLGGCAMADDAAAGVTDHRGRVFAGTDGDAVHEGLYVTDGSVIPMPIGVNPLLTISALAERSIGLLIAEQGGAIDDDPRSRPARPRRVLPAPGLGIRFTERMAGFVATGADADYATAARLGEACGSPMCFVLTLMTEDIDATLRDPDHRLRLLGTVHAPALSDEPLQVSGGQFSLFSADPERHDTSRMVYEMTLTATDGRRWSLRGVKIIHDDDGPDLWSDTTTLFVDLTDEEGAPAARGILRIDAVDFSRQVRTIQAIGARSAAEALAARVRFGRFFLGRLFDAYGDVFARPATFDPTAPPRQRRPLRAPVPELHYLRTSDGAPMTLTRYRGGDKGPVLLCHGLGVSSRIFTVDTIDTSLVEYLAAHGYDLWLLDTRASIDLPGAASPVTADLLAAVDLPEAVSAVREKTDAESVQLIGHCFGATVFYMSMLSGALSGVRSAITSQATPHVLGSRPTRLKSGLRLPRLLDTIGIDGLSAYTDTDAGWLDRLYDRGLSMYPVQREERCKSATCRRISFMYATLYEHDQLSVATHDTLHEQFGIANVAAFRHLSRMVRAGRLLDAGGRDVYMPHVHRLAIPIRMIHGLENACFDPIGSLRSLQWLQASNDPDLYSRVLIPDFGHIDCIFGERASEVVFPHILEHLEANL